MPSPKIQLLKRWLVTIRHTSPTQGQQNNDKSPVMKPELNEISEILDGKLYLSGCGVVTKENLASLRISGVVRAMTEEEENAATEYTKGAIVLPENIRSIRVRLADVETSDIQTQFDCVTAFIDFELKKGGKVLVHCGAGVSRSATLIIAYLMKYKKYTLRSAFALLRKKRKIVRPNNGFFRQLIEYERSLRDDGRASVRMILAPSGYSMPDIVFEDAVMAKLR